MRGVEVLFPLQDFWQQPQTESWTGWTFGPLFPCKKKTNKIQDFQLEEYLRQMQHSTI